MNVPFKIDTEQKFINKLNSTYVIRDLLMDFSILFLLSMIGFIYNDHVFNLPINAVVPYLIFLIIIFSFIFSKDGNKNKFVERLFRNVTAFIIFSFFIFVIIKYFVELVFMQYVLYFALLICTPFLSGLIYTIYQDYIVSVRFKEY